MYTGLPVNETCLPLGNTGLHVNKIDIGLPLSETGLPSGDRAYLLLK